MYELHDVRDSTKDNIISRVAPMCIFSQEGIGINVNQMGCFRTISIPKEELLSVEHLVPLVTPYPLGGGIEGIGGILSSEYC